MAWQGHRVGRVAGGGLYNGYRAPPKSKTNDWTLGGLVDVGFCKGLEVVGMPTGSGMPYLLWNPRSGARYEFLPHLGLSRVN